jgi:hypothetical protein
MWFTFSVENGSEEARIRGDAIAAGMSPADIFEANHRARENVFEERAAVRYKCRHRSNRTTILEVCPGDEIVQQP